MKWSHTWCSHWIYFAARKHKNCTLIIDENRLIISISTSDKENVFYGDLMEAPTLYRRGHGGSFLSVSGQRAWRSLWSSNPCLTNLAIGTMEHHLYGGEGAHISLWDREAGSPSWGSEISFPLIRDGRLISTLDFQGSRQGWLYLYFPGACTLGSPWWTRWLFPSPLISLCFHFKTHLFTVPKHPLENYQHV